MIMDKINIRFININQEISDVLRPSQEFMYVEQVAYDILELIGVGPVYRQLFGLRLVKKSLWLAPNMRLAELYDLDGVRGDMNYVALELRIKFIPSSFTKMKLLDETAFEMLFAQVRYDFLHSKFNKESRSHMLLNDELMGLIATDVLRTSIERRIRASDIYKHINHKDFVPHKASKWQRPLVFLLRKQLDIDRSVKSLAENYKSDPGLLKQGFVEHFIRDVCKEYGAEIYEVFGLFLPINPQRMLIKIVHRQTRDASNCIIEAREFKKTKNWVELCDIHSICYVTFHKEVVEINRFDGRPFRMSFTSDLHAKSFLSLLDGYFRLIRKWHSINFCRGIMSPDLEYLHKTKCHGPIGFESVKQKISPKAKRPGTFLIRRCTERTNGYMIDVLLTSKLRLQIDLNWCPQKKLFTIIENPEKKSTNVEVIYSQREHNDLKSLVNDIEIRVEGIKDGPPIQLTYWLPPSEYDDYPLLLLCISNTSLKKIFESGLPKSINELPKFIPADMLRLDSKRPPIHSDNGILVRSAMLIDESRVILKQPLCKKLTDTPNRRAVLINTYPQLREKLRNRYPLEQSRELRLVDWIFVKNSLFAETIGLSIFEESLIQEFLPKRLDLHLIKHNETPEITLRVVSCQLAQALLFLQERRIVHGKIRCHNLYIKKMNPIQIKVTDPLGTFDADRDQAFIPPEYSYVHDQLNFREYDANLDVWAVGTTIWQIYNYGARPEPGCCVLTRPKSCPDSVWTLIESCWINDPSNRATPQTIYRDLNDSFNWDKNSHEYNYISSDTNTENERPLVYNVTSLNESIDDLSEQSIDVSSGRSSVDGGSLSNLITRINVEPAHTNLKILSEVNLNRFRHHEGLAYLKRSARNLFKKLKEDFSDESYDRYTNSSMLSKKSSSLSSSKLNGDVPTKIASLDDSIMITHDFQDSAWQIDPSNLIVSSEIGRGSSGVITKGNLSEWRGFSGEVAIKSIHPDSDSPEAGSNDLIKEFQILKNLRHDNVLKIIGYVIGSMNEVQLIVEYMPFGSLLSYLRNSHHEYLLSLPLKKFALDIAEGMEYLESVKVVHRDLALRNVLVKDPKHVKICDFGLAQSLGTESHYKLKTDRALPLRWYAPETLATWQFSHKTDVWSYGIVLWEIYSGGCSPKYNCGPDLSNLCDILARSERLVMPKDCPRYMYNMMLNCWHNNPEQRPSFSEIRNHLDKFE